MSENELDKLRRQSATITARIHEIEDARKAKEMAQYVGRFFRYSNCYSCPESEEDRWWMYTRVLSVTEGGALNVFRFQTDKYGKVEIEETTRYTSVLGGEISEGQYLIALADLKAALLAQFQTHGA